MDQQARHAGGHSLNTTTKRLIELDRLRALGRDVRCAMAFLAAGPPPLRNENRRGFLPDSLQRELRSLYRVVARAGRADKLFLTFDDDPVLRLIVGKALLLTDDVEISAPMMLAQIKGSRRT